jgi:hypothetical protein
MRDVLRQRDRARRHPARAPSPDSVRRREPRPRLRSSPPRPPSQRSRVLSATAPRPRIRLAFPSTRHGWSLRSPASPPGLRAGPNRLRAHEIRREVGAIGCRVKRQRPRSGRMMQRTRGSRRYLPDRGAIRQACRDGPTSGGVSSHRFGAPSRHPPSTPREPARLHRNPDPPGAMLAGRPRHSAAVHGKAVSPSTPPGDRGRSSHASSLAWSGEPPVPEATPCGSLSSCSPCSPPPLL